MGVTMLLFLGLFLLILGGLAAIEGPADKEYLADWCVWVLAVLMALVGFIMVRSAVMPLLS